MADGNISTRKTPPTVRAATCPTSLVCEARVGDDEFRYLRITVRQSAEWMMMASRRMKKRAAKRCGVPHR